ncbi:hypothetical protein PPGU19_015790 [Paraburkholderia sp. PGU19]|nr:hypothetical protein PPGU19_015790 [Paraburkholderia sp. PGU19]
MKPNRLLQFIALAIGFAFLYVPIISLVVYSFNESQLVTVWTRFSTRWYAALLQDEELINAAWLSLRVALLTAFASVIIGTWAGFVLARMGRFRGFTLYTGMINAPLVIPEVIQGISLLLLFIEMGKWLGGRRVAVSSRSGSVTSCCAFPTWRLLCSRVCVTCIRRSRKRHWISAPRRCVYFSSSRCR